MEKFYIILKMRIFLTWQYDNVLHIFKLCLILTWIYLLMFMCYMSHHTTSSTQALFFLQIIIVSHNQLFQLPCIFFLKKKINFFFAYKSFEQIFYFFYLLEFSKINYYFSVTYVINYLQVFKPCLDSQKHFFFYKLSTSGQKKF